MGKIEQDVPSLQGAYLIWDRCMNEKLGQKGCHSHGFMILHATQNVIQQAANAAGRRIPYILLSS